MEFLKKHGEKILFVVLAGVLAASVAIAMGQRAAFEGTDVLTLREPDGVVSKNTEGIDRLLARLTTDPYRVEPSKQTFTPETRVMCVNPEHKGLIPPGMEVCVYCGEEQADDQDIDSDEDGIPNRLELKWGMDPNDPTDANMDQDGDGFPALYEYQEDTDPTDASDFPALIDFLRLADVEETSVVFELRGTASLGGKWTLQMYWKYPDQDRGRTEYIAVGERFGRDDEFLAESFTKRIVPEGDKYVDKSRAVIRSGRHVLELGREDEESRGRITESAATLELIFGPDWEETLRYGGEFTLDKKTYKVVDIQRSSVVLQPDDAESTLTIRPPTPEELEALEPPETEPLEGGPPFDGEEFPMEGFPPFD